MFSVDESCEDAQTSADKILDVVSLSDGSSYNDLWDRIVADLSLNKEKMATRTRLTERMSDDQFNETIDRIMKEATEYEQ